MPTEAPPYAVIGSEFRGSEGVTLLSAPNGRVVLFDTPEVARDCVSSRHLCAGEPGQWDEKREIFTLAILPDEGIWRVNIITPYDVYDVPKEWPVRSEARGLDWKHHIHWIEWYRTLDGGA